MRVSMDIELKDVPGQMLLALQPLSECKANLITVVHHHQRRTPRKTVPVKLVLETRPENVETIKAKLEENGIRVVRVGEQGSRIRLTRLTKPALLKLWIFPFPCPVSICFLQL